VRTGSSGEYLDLRGGWVKLHNAVFIICTSFQILLHITNQNGRDGQCLKHTRERCE
jgi:hypothetical protein